MRIEDEIGMKKFESEQAKAMVGIIYTGNWMTNQLLDKLKPYKINEQHFNILRILRGRFPGYACPGEIKDILINKRGDLTRLLDKLVKMGLIDRRQDENNRRSIQYFILQEGLNILTELDEMVDYKDSVLSKITDEEAKTLTKILDKLRS